MRAALTSFFLLAAMPACAATVTTIDVPGAPDTNAGSIGPSGIVGGGYVPGSGDPCGRACGYFRMPDGTFQTFPVFDSTNVSIDGVLDDGTAVGTYIKGTRDRGFARTPDGKIKDIFFHKTDTSMQALNASGIALGNTISPSGYSTFLRTPDGKTTVLAIPGCSAAVLGTGINAAGTVAGVCLSGNAPGPFLQTLGGQTTFLGKKDWENTGVGAIDDTGAAAGGYVDKHTGIKHGYVRNADGKYRSFDLPGDNPVNTYIVGMTVVGRDRQVVGWYMGQDTRYYGFVVHGNGSSEVFDVSGGSAKESGTIAAGISPSGAVVGTYFDDDLRSHGFIRTP
jgi:hypothetical protein